MAILDPADLKVGDILRGYWDVADGRGKAWHYGVVRRVVGSSFADVVLGTSLKYAEERVNRRSFLLVSPKTAAQHWAGTGLAKATLFDLRFGSMVRVPLNERSDVYGHLVGTIMPLLKGRRN